MRTLDEIFDRLIICDRRIAFIPGDGERRYTALAIEHPGVVRYLVKLFEQSWRRAEPVSYEPCRQRPQLLTDETRRNVMRLMVEGFTDTAISARLGISSRTVAAHIKKASEAFGSRSRAQLAYLIARDGFLDPLCETERGAPDGGAPAEEARRRSA